MKVRMINLGGTLGPQALSKLGASCYLYLFEIAGRTYTILVDSGMETSDDDAVSWQTPLWLSRLASFNTIDWVLITHAHRDHMAAIAVPEILDHLSDDAQIIGTRTTDAYLYYVLLDQIKIAQMKKEPTPYGSLEAIAVRKLMKNPVMRPSEIELVPGALWATLEPAGHIRGACSITFTVREGEKEVNIFHSGDYATHDQLSTKGAPLPSKRIDIISSFDCTNGGDGNLVTWDEAMLAMAEDAHRIVKSGGWVCDYAFAMDRCPTFARKLADLGVNVYMIGPSAQKLYGVMASADGFWCEHDLPFTLAGVHTPRSVDLDLEEPGAIVGPGGMANGPIMDYITELIQRPEALIGAGGYQAPGSNGYKIAHAKRGDTLRLEVGEGQDPVEVTVAAECKQYRPSGHTLRIPALQRIDEILKHSQFRKSGIPLVGLCHAQTPALAWFAESLRRCGYKSFRADREADRDIVLID